MKTITILICSILLNGCGSAKPTKASADMTQNKIESLNGSFYISKMGDNKTVSDALTMTFDDSKKEVSGFAGCNTFSAKYQINKNNIVFKNIIATEKYCDKDSNMVESTIMTALNTIDTYKIKDNTIIFSKGKKELLNTKPSISVEKTKQEQSNNPMTFEYKAFTRGTYKMIKVNSNKISAQLSRSGEASTKACSKADWDDILKLTDGLKVSSISKLKPPSTAHQYDGAAHATLTITDGENTYTTPTFDAGNPPKEIATLVNKILEIGIAPKEKTKN